VTHFYVYYRIDPARVDATRGAVEEIFAAIERGTGVRGRWMRRRDDPGTFMEVYENVADEGAFENALARATAQFGVERSTERFVCA